MKKTEVHVKDQVQSSTKKNPFNHHLILSKDGTNRNALGFISVAISSNGLNIMKKRAKNGHFFSKKTGKKRAKLKNVMEKNGRFRVFLYPLS